MKKITKELLESLEKTEEPIKVKYLYLTNGNYHNNSDAVYGRVTVLDPKEDTGIYDVIYYPENNELTVFKPGTDLKGILTLIYNNDLNDDSWIKWNGKRIQYKDLLDLGSREDLFDLANISRDGKENIKNKISNLYFNKDIEKIDYE